MITRFATRINKMEGSIIMMVDMYLSNRYFHGQLYATVPRATVKSNIKILTIKDQTNNSNREKKSESLVATTQNTVYNYTRKSLALEVAEPNLNTFYDYYIPLISRVLQNVIANIF